VRTAISPARLVVTGLALLLVVFIALTQIHSSDYLLVPDPAHAVAPLVHVQGGHPRAGTGGVYFVDVVEERATLLQQLIPQLRQAGSSLVPADQVIPPGANDASAHRLDREMMQNSQRFAAAVALRSAGYPVITRPFGVQVDAVAPDSDAAGKIFPGDLVTGVDDTKTLTPLQLIGIVHEHRIGQVVRVHLVRDGKQSTVPVKLSPAAASGPARRFPAIGLAAIEQSASVKLPRKVTIDIGRVGGPSAGLAFALEIASQLGQNVTHGYRVAVTGALDLDGTVEPIGGVKQKTYGARAAHADVFLVPAGDNAAEARRWAHSLRIIPVRSYQQALRALATLPPKQ
jgi:PDZ domain-containing protein